MLFQWKLIIDNNGRKFKFIKLGNFCYLRSDKKKINLGRYEIDYYQIFDIDKINIEILVSGYLEIVVEFIYFFKSYIQ